MRALGPASLCLHPCWWPQCMMLRTQWGHEVFNSCVHALISLRIPCISSQKIAIHCVVGDESTEGGVGYLWSFHCVACILSQPVASHSPCSFSLSAWVFLSCEGEGISPLSCAMWESVRTCLAHVLCVRFFRSCHTETRLCSLLSHLRYNRVWLCLACEGLIAFMCCHTPD